MQSELIRPKQCFQLRCGEVIRVKSVESKKIYCELFDSGAKRWIPLRILLPTWTLYAPCADPMKHEEKVGTIRRWWNSRRRTASAIAK